MTLVVFASKNYFFRGIEILFLKVLFVSKSRIVQNVTKCLFMAKMKEIEDFL